MRGGMHAWVVAALMLVGAGAAASSSEPAPQLITHIEVVASGLDDPAPLLEVLGLRAGQAIDRSRLREGVHALFAGGEVEHLRVESESTEGGVHLRLHIRLRSRIDRVEIHGVGLLWRGRVSDWMDLRPGGTVSAARLEAGAARVLRELRRRGYADAVVEPSIRYHRASNSVDLAVVVELGLPRRLRSVRARGVPDAAVVAAVEPEPGGNRRLTRRLLERMRDDVEAAVRSHGYWEAQVIAVDQVVDGDQVDLELRFDPGERYRVEIVAPHDSLEVVEKAIPDPSAETLHAAQSAVLAEQIREQLQLAGYLLAEVAVEVADEAAEGEALVRIQAEPGVVNRVAEISFPGALELAERQLLKAIRVRQGKVEGWRGQELSDATLEEDRVALEGLYREHGFAEVVVDKATIEGLDGDAVRISFAIHEGTRWRVSELIFEGFPVESMAALESTELPLVSAGPWRPDRLDELSRQLNTVLANTGYPGGRVELRTSELRRGEMAVTAVADAGVYVSLGEVVVVGLKQTRESVVRDTLQRAGVVSGAAYSHAAILRAQNLLYELGLFRRVELVPIPGQENRSVRGLVVRCEEGLVRSYLLGIGWDTEEQTRLTLGWSHLNLFGGAHAVSVETRVSSRQLRFQASLREPRVPLLDLPGYVVAYSTEEEFTSYSQARRGVWFEVGDRRRRPFRHWYRLEYQVVEPDAPDDVLSELEREDQQIKVASLTPALEWDRRDDPLNPRHGHFVSSSLAYAFPVFDAEAEFLKAQVASSWYRSIDDRATFAAGLRLGAIEPLGPDTGEPANLQVPIGTRFFAGGHASHRAFKLDTLGVPGLTLDEDGNPIGGNALVLLNLEVERTLWGPLAAALFVDGGNVWDKPSSVSWPDLRWGVGFGLRYATPAGPLRLEYGRKLDRVAGESRGEIFLSFGTPF